MNTTETNSVSVQDQAAGASVVELTPSPVPYPQDVAGDIWRVLMDHMGRALQARNKNPDIDFQDYLDFLETITAGELVWFLFHEDEELQTEIVNNWLDDMTTLSEK